MGADWQQVRDTNASTIIGAGIRLVPSLSAGWLGALIVTVLSLFGLSLYAS